MELKNKILSTGVFEDNEFLDKYCELIISNQDSLKIANVTDTHHIIPKSYYSFANLKIDNTEENLVHLTYSNHIMAHYYLCLFTSDGTLKSKMVYAFMMMTHTRKLPETEQELLQNLDQYKNLHNEWTNLLYLKMKNNQYAKGNILSEETRQKMGASRMGRPTRDETRDKLSKSASGSKWVHKDGIYTHVSGKKLEEYLLNGWEIGGRPATEETKKAISAQNTGKKRSEEAKAKMSKAARGRIPWNKGKKMSEETKKKNSKIQKNRIHINNGIQEKFVKPEQIQDYLDDGWVKGRMPFKKILQE